MINLKKIFYPNPCLLSFTKREKELFRCFFEHKAEFDHWLSFHPNQRIQFRFYYPTAIDLYFDGHKLFTAYFKKTAFGAIELQEFKMSSENFASIRTPNWQPFEDVMRTFLTTLEENNKTILVRQTKSLHEYAALCRNRQAPKQKGDFFNNFREAIDANAGSDENGFGKHLYKKQA